MLIEAKDFFTDAKRVRAQQIPILVMFSAPDCPYCQLLKDEVLNSMSELAEYKNKVIIRHISYSSLDEIINFTNEYVTHEQFNFHYGVNFYPTLMLFDDYGNSLGKKIGITLIDHYWTELDDLITQATQKLKQRLKAVL